MLKLLILAIEFPLPVPAPVLATLPVIAPGCGGLAVRIIKRDVRRGSGSSADKLLWTFPAV